MSSERARAAAESKTVSPVDPVDNPGCAAVFGAASVEAATHSLASPRRRRGAVQPGVLAGTRGGVTASHGAHLAQARHPESAGVVVAADATLCYRDDLLRRLREAEASVPHDSDSLSDADLILLAYGAWGERLIERLEGDFVFVLWDEGRQRGLAAVDSAGTRSLFYAPAAGSLSLGTSVGRIRKLGADDLGLNTMHVAEIAAGFWANSDETCYRGVHRLLPGHRLSWSANEGVRVDRYWSLPEATGSPDPFPSAAGSLRELLVAAVGERLDRYGRCAVWMSGGWDSTAVFAAGQEWLRRSGRDPRLLAPISISYPPGDPGREDELIIAAASHWDAEPHWLSSSEIPILEGLEELASDRDEPWGHPFEQMNRALARASQRVGAQAAFSGHGGDVLFASPVGQLSDLFWRGRWSALRRELVERKARRFKTVLRYAILPGVPRWGYELVRAVRGGRRTLHFLDRPVPAWFTDEYAGRLMDRQWDDRAWPRPGRVSAAEMAYYFRSASSPRLNTFLRRVALEAGVALETPMLDRRIVELATNRPADERSRGLETKLLLRGSMKGLLPDSVLAPRARKTGLAGSYLTRAVQRAMPGMLDRLGNPMLLQEFGMIDQDSFVDHCRRFERTGGTGLASSIVSALQTEFWLRSHVD